MPQKNRRIPRFVWRGIHTSPTVVVAIATALAERAKRLGARRVITIPNGVDFAHLASIPRLKKNPHRVVTVARLSPEKGLPYLIEAMKTVRHSVPDAELAIVGGGALEAELKAFTRSLSLQDVVHFLGAKPNRDAMTEVARSDIFVLPSLGEGLGIVLLEAQALGVPVIGTRVGGIPDVIADGETGLLVPPSEPTALAAAIVRLLSDAALAKQLAIHAQAKLPNFDWNKIAERYVEVYNNL